VAEGRCRELTNQGDAQRRHRTEPNAAQQTINSFNLFPSHFNDLCFFVVRLTGKEKRVGGFDLMWNDGPVYNEDFNPETFGSSCFTANTYLGNLTNKQTILRL